MNDLLRERIHQCASLPSLPAIAIQVLDLAQRDEVDLTEIARVISKDPALSSKILRTVNSSFYGRSQSISTISHALVILGLQSVKTLVLGFSLVSNLNRQKARGFKHLAYWQHSIYAATAARTFAGKFQFVQQEECFLAALLADIGMLVLDQVLGEGYGEICQKAANHEQLAAVEQEELGATHAEVSGILAERWKLPPVLVLPMANHHSPSAIEDPSLRKLTEVVCLACRCADIFVNEDAAESIAHVRRVCLEQHRIPEAECDAILDDICTRTKEVATLFEINVGPTNYEQILKKANEALVELTLRTQQQAVTLEQQNLQLKHQATTDALTGLANRARFDAFIEEQFAAAAGSGKPLSLVIVDIDKFKSINDTHGHQAGDEVLRSVGKLLRSAARAQDLAARYGGEELVLVMPGTPRATAAAVAESIRRAIAAKPLRCDSAGVSLSVTASIGVASCEPGSPFRETPHLIKAADMALYAAKHGGRNCVKVFSVKAAA